MAKNCLHGHDLIPENIYIVPKTGHRICLLCKRAAYKRDSVQRRDKDYFGGVIERKLSCVTVKDAFIVG